MKRPLLIGGIVVSAIVGVCFALWSATVGISSPAVAAGQLAVQPTRLVVTSGCITQTVAPAAELPALPAWPDQPTTVTGTIEVRADGDNLAVALQPTFDRPLPDQVSATWSLTVDGDTETAAWGQPISRPAAALHATMTIEVILTWDTAPVWVDPASVDPPELELGRFSVALQQIRCGSGFVGGC